MNQHPQQQMHKHSSIPREVRLMVERALRNAEGNRRRLEKIFANMDNPDMDEVLNEARMDVIMSGSSAVTDMRTIKDISNPTMSKALALMGLGVALNTILVLQAIEKALHTYPECIPLYERHYRDGQGRGKVCCELPVSESGVYRLRGKLVRQIADDMGWLE